MSKDKVTFTFKNGSVIENVAAAESTRGSRYQCLVLEECASMEGDVLNQVLIPTLNVDRIINGMVDEEEKLNRSQLYITTAGYKATFAYEKLIQLLCMSVVKPKEAMVMGGSYVISMKEGTLSKDEILNIDSDSTYDESTFEREYKLLLVLYKLG